MVQILVDDTIATTVSKPYNTLPSNYYEKRADSRVSRPLHFIGRKLVSGLLNLEQGKKLYVQAPQSVHEVAESAKPILVSATHRSWMDIPQFVEATEAVGIRHVRPLSKIENIQKSRILAWYFHQVGLFAADRDNPDMAGINKVFASAYANDQNTLIFPEGTRVKENIAKIDNYARTPALMALQYGFAITHLAIVGGGSGETSPGKHSVFGKRLAVADKPVALFGEIIELELNPDRNVLLQAGEHTRKILKPDLQGTLDRVYQLRQNLA
jgi:1-acyl-sn-glycerol-3-phosphate acyltransferase